jgi:hypothetical protein
MKKSIVLFLAILFYSGLQAQDSQTFENKIKEYINLSGGQESFEVAIDQMMDMYKELDDSEEMSTFFESFSREIKEESIDKLMVLLIPIYKKHITEAEIDAGITYLKSPLGKSLASKNPAIMAESMQAGAIWGQEIGERIIEKMETMKKN